MITDCLPYNFPKFGYIKLPKINIPAEDITRLKISGKLVLSIFMPW